MIKQAVLLLSFLSVSCNCTKNQLSDKVAKEIVSNSCPSDGKCTTYLIKNKSLNIKTDEIGAIYYDLNDNSKTSIIKFEYNKTVDTTLQDNNYREEILFEIPNKIEEINLENNELKSVKMLFGKHCYCRGQAGIYIIKKGNLKIIREDKNISFNLEFEVPNIDHKVKKISESIK
jgi:hypothetical protein